MPWGRSYPEGSSFYLSHAEIIMFNMLHSDISMFGFLSLFTLFNFDLIVLRYPSCSMPKFEESSKCPGSTWTRWCFIRAYEGCKMVKSVCYLVWFLLSFFSFSCSWLVDRNWSLQIGSFTNLHSQFHLEHIILRPCCLYILKEFELLCTQQIWYMLTGITKVRDYGCKIFPGKTQMIWIKKFPLRMI